MREERIRIEKLKKSFAGVQVLKGLDLTLYKGEILGVTGLNSSGKSVLADIISGRTAAGEGAVYVSGVRRKLRSVREAQGLGIYCIRRISTLIPELSLMQNLCLTGRAGGGGLAFPSGRQKKLAAGCLAELAIDFHPSWPAGLCSAAFKHRLEIGRAYYSGARVLVLDQITGDYTRSERMALEELLDRLRRKGAAVIWIESKPELLLPLADRLLIMRRGTDAAVLYRSEFEGNRIRKIMTGDGKAGMSEKEGVESGRRERENLFEVRQIGCRAFHDLSFTVGRGEIVGFLDEDRIVCPDVVRLMSGGFDITGGVARKGGEEISLSGGRLKMVRRGVGFIGYYKSSLFPRLTTLENLTAAALPSFGKGVGISRRLEEVIALEYMDRLNISRKNLHRPIECLSNQEQLNVALYKWMIAKADLIVMENVFSGADLVMRGCILRFIREAGDRGMGIIYTSPDVREIENLCDRIYVVKEGRITRAVTLESPAGPIS